MRASSFHLSLDERRRSLEAVYSGARRVSAKWYPCGGCVYPGISSDASRVHECAAYACMHAARVRTCNITGWSKIWPVDRCRSPLKRYPIISRESLAAENDYPRAAPVVLAAHTPAFLRLFADSSLCYSPFAPSFVPYLSRESLSFETHIYTECLDIRDVLYILTVAP